MREKVRGGFRTSNGLHHRGSDSALEHGLDVQTDESVRRCGRLASAEGFPMSKPQPSISVQFGREWRIRRPVIYRYLEKTFVDSFFETGSLRISSFSTFAKHKDEERQDSKEGYGLVVHRNNEGQGQTMVASISQGHNAYVLCGAMSFRPELAQAFGADSGFRINDSIGFSEAISKYIPGFYIGMEGPCLYLPRRTIDRDMGPVDLDSMKVSPEGKELDMGKLFQAVFSAAGDDLFFLKSDRFAHQNEYRLLWHSPREVSGHIDIVCPEARQFCTRFEDMWAESSSGYAAED